MRIAFDLDETLGVPLIDNNSIAGFHIRDGAIELLEKLSKNNVLILWSVSSRRYLEKILSFGLKQYFEEIYSWDEIATKWKDIRQIRADFLIDDSEHHRENAVKYGLEQYYIVVSAYGSPEDSSDPLLWVRQIEDVLFRDDLKGIFLIR